MTLSGLQSVQGEEIAVTESLYPRLAAAHAYNRWRSGDDGGGQWQLREAYLHGGPSLSSTREGMKEL